MRTEECEKGTRHIVGGIHSRDNLAHALSAITI